MEPFRNKRKILNDPVYGFITIPNELIFELVEHAWFQRLRRILQLGLTHLVYPGALHTRFHHALGAMHLMMMALEVLRSKGINISPKEEEGALAAILLHDIGHGPYSHALENTLIKGVSHEHLSLQMMEALNKELGGKLDEAINIFKGSCEKQFLYQLVSSQLDTDRLDYLTRDSYFTGVSEGVIGTERIIKMLNVSAGELVVDEKGIYSIEKFLVSRRLMYWQVYLHKTVVSAENLMIRILERAKYLATKDVPLHASPALHYFLYDFRLESGRELQTAGLDNFIRLDDYDVLASIKVWQYHSDKVLALLSRALIQRKLFRIIIGNEPVGDRIYHEQQTRVAESFGLSPEESEWFIIKGETSNQMYVSDSQQIKILSKSGKVNDILQASDQLNYIPLGKVIRKHFLCFPKADATV